MATQEKCVEAKKETNSTHEEMDVSNRHMTWWRDRCLVGPYGQRPTLTDGARPSKSVASSHESGAGSARDRMGRRGRKGETGARENGEQRKQPFARCLPLTHCNHRSSRSSNCSDSALAVTLETKFIAKPVVELLAMVDLDLSSTAILTSLMIFSSLRRSSFHLRRVWWVVVPWDMGSVGR